MNTKGHLIIIPSTTLVNKGFHATVAESLQLGLDIAGRMGAAGGGFEPEYKALANSWLEGTAEPTSGAFMNLYTTDQVSWVRVLWVPEG